MTFLIESIIACAFFTLFVFLMSRDPVKTIFNYPPAIIGSRLNDFFVTLRNRCSLCLHRQNEKMLK